MKIDRDLTERRLLSSLAFDSSDFPRIASLGFKEYYFQVTANRSIYKNLVNLTLRGSKEPFEDLIRQYDVSSCDHKDYSMQYLKEISSLVYTSSKVIDYAQLLIDLYKRDQLNQHLSTALEINSDYDHLDSFSVVMAGVKECILKINDLSHSQQSRLTADSCEDVIQNLQNPDVNPKLSLGITDKLGKIKNFELITIGGRPGDGKTAIALQLMNHVMSQGGRVAFFSLEMTSQELIERLAIHRAGVASCGDHPAAIKERIEELKRLKKFDKLHIYEQAQSESVAAIISTATFLSQAKGGLSLVIIDYLQLLNIEKQSHNKARYEQVGEITKQLKKLSVNLRVPILLLAQLNRDSEKDDRIPRLSDLRESGSIEQDSDRVWLLYKKSNPEGGYLEPDAKVVPMFISQMKCRGGQAGIALQVDFNKPCFKFSNIVAPAPTITYTRSINEINRRCLDSSPSAARTYT